MPLPKTEDSISLRVLVQGLVIIGIIAVDVAAGTQMSLWATPLSIVGATWSWYRRRKRNVTVKFLLAIGMLFAVFAFFCNLLGNLNDTRMVLAQLLIQLQILHSFDLPRRKDLGYSMVIGLILLGVAGTVSQTSIFAVLLLLFLAVALPSLILDYRSRLGLPSTFKRQRRPQSHSPLSLQRLSLIALLVLLLGLTIFALMPRFPGYKLQTFPVSSPAELEEQNFDLQDRSIVNPGYAQEGEGGGSGGAGTGEASTQGTGEVDQTFYYGFNSQMNQNLRGQMERKLVLRIRSQAPGFWRVHAFDRYTGQGWEASDDHLIDIERPSWTYRFTLPPIPATQKTKKVVQSYSVVSDFPNLIPALSYPKYLYFPTQEVALSAERSLRSPVSLLEGLTYTVVSEIPYRDRTALSQAPQDYPERIKRYLQLPEETDQIRQQAQALLAKSPSPITSPYEQALFLAQALKQNYTIQPELPFFDPEEDLVKTFLFRYKGGYPDHFSTVLTVMLRSLGIPARLAVGFAPGQFNPFTGYYLVHNTDAYAITEVYFPGYGWFAFDPIPGHEVIPPSFEESQTFGVLRQFWHWVASWLPSPVTSFASQLWRLTIGGLIRIVVWLWRFFSSSLLGWLIGMVFVSALGFLGWLGWNGLKDWRDRRRLAKLPPIERLYQRMLRALKEKGTPKHPAQTPLEYVQATRQHHPHVAKIVEEISQAYVGWRYGDKPPEVSDLQQQFKALTNNLRSKK